MKFPKSVQQFSFIYKNMRVVALIIAALILLFDCLKCHAEIHLDFHLRDHDLHKMMMDAAKDTYTRMVEETSKNSSRRESESSSHSESDSHSYGCESNSDSRSSD